MKKLPIHIPAMLLLAVLLTAPAHAQEKTLQQLQQEAVALEAREDWAAAEKIYRDMSLQFPEDALAYFHAGRYFTDRRLYKEAVSYLEKGLEKDPESETAHLYLARLYIELGDMAKSQEHSRKVLEIQEKIRSQNVRPEPAAPAPAAEGEAP